MFGEGLQLAPSRVLGEVRISSFFHSHVQGGQRQPDVDRAADGVAADLSRSGIEDEGDADEASRDCGMGEFGGHGYGASRQPVDPSPPGA
jgi:hypothetical protein